MTNYDDERTNDRTSIAQLNIIREIREIRERVLHSYSRTSAGLGPRRTAFPVPRLTNSYRACKPVIIFYICESVNPFTTFLGMEPPLTFSVM